MDNFFNSLNESVARITQETNKALRHIFGNQIKGTFLIEIKEKVLHTLGEEMFKYYDFSLSMEKSIQGTSSEMEYDVCRHIVGIHNFNLIFLGEDDRVQLERSSEYKDSLVRQVIENVKLRNYGSVYFRKQPLMKCENFIFYPLAYDCFVMTMRIFQILTEVKKIDIYYDFYVKMCNKTLAALSLLEDGFLDNTYPTFRGVLELFVKYLLTKNIPNILNEFNKFVEYDIQKTCGGVNYPEEFVGKYNKRLNIESANKIDYLQYGYVDFIPDYHKIVRNNPYSFNGVLRYLKAKSGKESKNFFNNIEAYYKLCHGFTHGSVGNVRYPLNHFFNITDMVGLIIQFLFKYVCQDYGKTEEINGINISEKYLRDFEKFQEKYNQRSTENFDLYYKNKR